MNQLATMLDTDLTVDPRARSARSADEAESGVDFGQVLQGLSKPEDASVDSAGFGHVRRHAKKGVGDGLAITTSESIVPTSPLEGAKGAPLTPIDIGSVLAKVDARATPSASSETKEMGESSTKIDAAAVSLGSTEIGVSVPNGAPNASLIPATNGASGTSAAAVTAGSAGQASRVGLSRSDVIRGEDTGRATPAADAAKVVNPALVEGVESGSRLAGKSMAGGAGGSGAGMVLNAASAAVAASAAKGSGSGDSTRLATSQPKPPTSLETKAFETRSPTLSLTDPGAWSLGALTREDSTSALRQPVAAEATMTAPMGSEEWQMDLGTQLVAMIEKGDQSAVINLSPVELGPVQIDVAVHEGEVSVAFAAQVADTRAAIEASLPKLRELLAGEGLSLTNSNINNMLSGFSQQKSSSRGNEERPSQRGRFAEPESAVLIQSAPNRVRRSLVDLYA
jgi:flagellar hook-length control protein FliK